ncbi:MAG: zinc-dependent peptidase [Verrucomicrobiae bacterium]|nr:zinc-dependent peptidase [Verrucomicrobiae bacterium]
METPVWKTDERNSVFHSRNRILDHVTGILIALVGTLLLAFAVWKTRRVRVETGLVLEVDTFSPEWDDLLERRFAVYRHLPDELRDRLRDRVRAFVNEKQFEACGGLETITEEMRVLVAAQAALLLVGRPKDRLYPRLHSVLMYPGAFRDRGKRVFGPDDDDDHERDIRLGESWNTGSVILAWDSVQRGAARDDDGMNVVLHEFAHQLDQADGSADGVPALGDDEAYFDWEKIMKREYETLVGEAEDPRADPLLDPYGATNPAEFFAVATETFFELSEDLRDEHPELFRELRDYYGVDPTEWKNRNRA